MPIYDLANEAAGSWMDRDLDLLTRTIEARRERNLGSADEVLDDSVASITAIRLMYKTVMRKEHGAIDCDSYLSRLLEHMSEAYLAQLGVRAVKAGIVGHLPAPIAKDLGLALVEMVALSARYGLRKGRGQITIAVFRSSHRIRLRVRNDGIGELDPLASEQQDAFRLIKTFASALGATVFVQGHHGLGSTVSLTTAQISHDSGRH